MNKLIVASNNKHKIIEIKEMLVDFDIEILSLEEANINLDVEETGTSFKENALLKAKAIYQIVQIPVLSDDSGLEVEALANEPGIYSARYAGLDKDDKANNEKLLTKMKNQKHRSARYVCAMALVIDNKTIHCVEDYLYGEIIDEYRGTNGFGYDPLFYLKDLDKTLAQISLEEKNRLSHRYKALKKIYNIIKELV
ncbi:XTP/dITP diphosphatase [Erysipelotrichaceae bacterium OttesenSCG-928-M19]|nr:XTP/dITP diphosphatase [Erysipelotrichaceae bacterium OttesenSCG-928-M19]